MRGIGGASAALVLFAACATLEDEAPATPVSGYLEDPAALARGRAIFRSACSGYCHQMTPTQTDALFLFDCSWKHGSGDQDIFNVISNGVPETRMVGFGDALPEGYDDTWRVVAFLRSQAQCE